MESLVKIGSANFDLCLIEAYLDKDVLNALREDYFKAFAKDFVLTQVFHGEGEHQIEMDAAMEKMENIFTQKIGQIKDPKKFKELAMVFSNIVPQKLSHPFISAINARWHQLTTPTSRFFLIRMPSYMDVTGHPISGAGMVRKARAVV
jgi:hypothetical protein